MSSSYVAYFATPNLLSEMKQVNWDSEEEAADFFDQLDEQKRLRVWGECNDGWMLSAMTEWLCNKFPALLPKVANTILPDCAYVHWTVSPANRSTVMDILNKADPRNDPSFAPGISEYFEALGSDFVEGYVEQGFDTYYQAFDDLKNDLKENDGETLVVMIPY